MIRHHLARIALPSLIGAVLLLSGCAIKHPTANLERGKQLFVTKCGACHALSHASSTGTVGPNLDDAFAQARADGISSHAIQGLVDFWIQYPNSQGVMPAGLYRGQSAEDVASYVARVAAEPGHDTGALAQAVQQTVPETPAAGKTIFTGVGGCGACHTLAAAGTTGTTGPNLTERLASDCRRPESVPVRGASLQRCIMTAIIKPYAFIPQGYTSGIMPSDFARTLSPSQIKALVAFLRSVTR